MDRCFLVHIFVASEGLTRVTYENFQRGDSGGGPSTYRIRKPAAPDNLAQHVAGVPCASV